MKKWIRPPRRVEEESLCESRSQHRPNSDRNGMANGICFMRAYTVLVGCPDMGYGSRGYFNEMLVYGSNM